MSTIKMKFFKLVRRHPESRAMVDTYSGSVIYSVGDDIADTSDHGLSVHSTAHRAMTHGVPAESVGRNWPGVLISVTVDPTDIISRGNGPQKTLVRRLRVTSIERDNIHPDIVQQNFSPHRMADAETWLSAGWGGFREVAAITRGAPKPINIPTDRRQDYVIECRPSSTGRYGKPVDYRATRRV